MANYLKIFPDSKYCCSLLTIMMLTRITLQLLITLLALVSLEYFSRIQDIVGIKQSLQVLHDL
jgi:hypothetical protein